MKTLIIIDVQNDFMPNGALPVPQGDRIIPYINAAMAEFDLIVATQDWHPSHHMSFASNHPGKKPFDTISLQIQGQEQEQILWPNHCMQGSSGADFHPDLNTHPIQAIFRKGMNPMIDSYSGFYDNHHQNSTGLAGYLKEKSATELYFCGLCADICVYFSIKDALAEGFTCYLLEAGTCALSAEHWQIIRQELVDSGVVIM